MALLASELRLHNNDPACTERHPAALPARLYPHPAGANGTSCYPEGFKRPSVLAGAKCRLSLKLCLPSHHVRCLCMLLSPCTLRHRPCVPSHRLVIVDGDSDDLVTRIVLPHTKRFVLLVSQHKSALTQH